MAWIHSIEFARNNTDLQRVYERLAAERGKISEIMRVQSLQPRALEAHLDLYLALMFGRSGLSREERELIGIAVSAANHCRYCVAHHVAALNHYWKDEDRVRAFAEDPSSVLLPARAAELVRYALKLTRSPDQMSEPDVDSLRTHGLQDEDILTANMITSYFNFVNRIATGLGVEPAEDEVGGYRY
ncbi:MAG: peroxidase-related enzyme [Gemmatimonadota bacterium]